MTDRERGAVWIAVAVALLLTGYVLLVAAGEPGSYSSTGRILDLTWGYTPEFVRDEFTRYGPEGRREYAEFLLTDAVYIPIYSACAVTIIAITWTRRWPRRWLAAIALATGVVDLIEDSLNWSTLNAFPALDPLIVELASRTTIAKWFLVAATVIAIIAGIVTRWRDLVPTSGFGRSSETAP